MSKPIIVIHNVETDEIIEREMNDAEFAQWQKDQAEEQLRKEAKANAEAARAALLEKLGITQDEAKLLLG